REASAPDEVVQRGGLLVPPARRSPAAGEVPRDEDPLQRGRWNAAEDLADRASEADVPGAPLGEVDQVDAERFGDPLAIASPELGSHTDDAGCAIDASELGGPPLLRGLLRSILI